MKVAIIGAGFGGLAAGHRLAKNGVDVTIFESDSKPGGLAVGFKQPNWKWTMEAHYHHWFTNDSSAFDLAKEIGHKVEVTRPKTSTFIEGKIYQLDSPLSLLLFNKLNFIDRLRTGLILAILKLIPLGTWLERTSSENFLKRFMGTKSWEILWKPLFDKKFSSFSREIAASWFWARIKKRTASLGYPEGGFLAFAEHLDELIKKYRGNIFYKTPVRGIYLNEKTKKIIIETNKESYEYDKVICTLPSPLFVKITKRLPENYVKKLLDLKGIGAVNLLLSLKQPFLEDGTYWLNINASHFPFLAIVEHTNFMKSKHYGGEHLIYIGNYLPHEHPYYQKDIGDLLREFYPFLKTINPKFDRSWITKGFVFKAPFAQPIIPLNYSKNVPAFVTPIKGLYLCNIQQVYPWDRGTNYAIENGETVAKLILSDLGF